MKASIYKEATMWFNRKKIRFLELEVKTLNQLICQQTRSLKLFDDILVDYANKILTLEQQYFSIIKITKRAKKLKKKAKKMPSKTEKQKKFMAAAAHDKKFADKAGIPQSVAKEFNAADKQKAAKKKPHESMYGKGQ